ncbi:hypothetical protein SCOR_11025 [Sulfidibacter corallicola]
MNIGNQERIRIWCHIMVLLFLVSIILAFLIKIWRRQDPAQECTTLFEERSQSG